MDVRIISATNRDLEASVREGAFREDLFYRLNVVTMSLPPLRERKEDLTALIDHYLEKFARENGKKNQGLTAEARDLLLKYDYPGNIRELVNIMERAVVIAREDYITVGDLPFKNESFNNFSDRNISGSLLEMREELEKNLIIEAMAKADNNQTKAAVKLGMTRRMLRYKIKKYNL